MDNASERKENVDFSNIARHCLDDEINGSFFGDVDFVVHDHCVGKILAELVHSVIGVDSVEDS